MCGETSDKSGSLISRLRRDYRAKGPFSATSLAAHWLRQSLQEVPRQGLSGRELQALALRVAQQLQDLHVKSWTGDEVSEEEYVHAMLLLKVGSKVQLSDEIASEAQDRAAAQIYLPLRASLAKCRGI